ncbi:hypothetical protein TIFTF001_033035 [Ficus carica]|uniref:Uncharacterized protein n=1 Tax=Ficus carica TaxID=3494 RepID=A0AA88DY80_FICCA|nr:hypothetical protein TIFTF001_033035 [Ficus carica]
MRQEYHVAAGVHAARVVRVRSPPIRRQRRPRSLSPLRSPPSAHELTLIATSAPPPPNRGTRDFNTFKWDKVYVIGAYKMEVAAAGFDSDLGFLATLLKLKRRSGWPKLYGKERLSRPNQ